MRSEHLEIYFEIRDTLRRMIGDAGQESDLDRSLARASRIRDLDGCFDRDNRSRHRRRAAERMALARGR